MHEGVTLCGCDRNGWDLADGTRQCIHGDVGTGVARCSEGSEAYCSDCHHSQGVELEVFWNGNLVEYAAIRDGWVSGQPKAVQVGGDFIGPNHKDTRNHPLKISDVHSPLQGVFPTR